MKNFTYSVKTLILIALVLASITINATTYTVTSTANGTTTDGVSLRWAITQANGAAGNSIVFNIPGAAPHIITLTIYKVIIDTKIVKTDKIVIIK